MKHSVVGDLNIIARQQTEETFATIAGRGAGIQKKLLGEVG
jgi:hypothetical protein